MQSPPGSGSETPPPAVLAAIVHYGAAHVDLTVRAAASVLDQGEADGLAVVVIDNGSDETTRRGLRAGVDPRAELIGLPMNRGYGAAANVAIGLAVARGIQRVWLLNNDVVVEPGALSILMDALDRDQTLAAAAPITVDDASPRVVLGAGVSLATARARARHHDTGRDAATLPTGVRRVDAIEAAAVLLRVSATESVGGFDERFFMYWEDTEWSVRARRAGWRLGVALGARVRHQVARSSLPADRAELMIGNRIRFARTALGAGGNVLFATYMALWLPAYALARLWPAFGLRRALRIAARAVTRNVRDARRNGGWLIPATTPAGGPTTTDHAA